MTIALTSPVTGAAQTGLTSPTFTVTADTAPPGNPGKQYAVTALGGTQSGVVAHSVAAPFTTNFTRPAILKVLGPLNPITNVPRATAPNKYSQITRKGVLPLAGQPYQVMIARTDVEVPAGADVADPTSVRSCLSFHNGAMTQQSAGFGDTAINGIL